MSDHSSLKVGTVTGTILTILGSIGWNDILRTLVLGALGAIVSFFISFFLKKLTARCEGKREGSR